MGLDGDFNLRRLERYMVLAQESGAWPVVLLTKADLCSDVSSRITAVRAVATGANVHAIAALQNQGLDQVREYLQPHITAVMLGSSGAGKSTLLNALLGEQRMATREVRESDSRGRHTTTHRELIELPGGACIIDTPGMRELQLWADEESVLSAFTDIEDFAARCRFTDCRHESEPGCAVLDAVDRGELDPARLANLHKLRREAEHIAIEADPLARRARNAKWKSINKSMRYHPKYMR
jgi:ribosome biogenesis GTPase